MFENLKIRYDQEFEEVCCIFDFDQNLFEKFMSFKDFHIDDGLLEENWCYGTIAIKHNLFDISFNCYEICQGQKALEPLVRVYYRKNITEESFNEDKDSMWTHFVPILKVMNTLH